MSILHSKETQVLIERLISEDARLPASNPEMFKSFVREYYHKVPFDDLKERELIDLQGCALAHWNTGLICKPRQTKIRVYNPDTERHGWQSTHTIMEIVTEDKPFLVDSVTLLLNRMGLTIHLTVHPMFTVQRDATGKLKSIEPPESSKTGNRTTETYLHVEFDRRTNAKELTSIKKELQDTLNYIDVAFADWSTMRSKALEAADDFQKYAGKSGSEFKEDDILFCKWLEEGNFAFLGYCELLPKNKSTFELDTSSLMGVLRKVEDVSTVFPASELGNETHLQSLLITKANTRSPVHRPSYMDLITTKKYPSGKGIRVFVGLFASTAYNRSAKYIPVLRTKLEQVIKKSGLSSDSYDGRNITNIMDTYPRDILFRISVDELFSDVATIMELQERQKVRVLSRRDRYGRFYSVLVYLPRERYSRQLRVRIQDILIESLQGISAEFDATFTESVLVRINYTIHTNPEDQPIHSEEEIHRRVEDASQTWEDLLKEAMVERYGEEKGIYYADKYSNSFSAGYQEDFSPRTAVADVHRLEQLSEDQTIEIALYRPWTDPVAGIQLKLFNYGKPISPSDALPVIENMGLRVIEARPYVIRAADSVCTCINDYRLEHADRLEFDLDEVRSDFEEAFIQVWNGRAGNDGFNRLVLNASLTWREVVVLRTYCLYFRQIGFPYSVDYVIQTLVQHPHMTARLAKLFSLRFDPKDKQQDKNFEKHLQFVESRLEHVLSLDEDTILRGYMNAILSTIRTNYFRTDNQGRPLDYLSLKIDSGSILRMPEPRPLYEIFVYSTRTEAIHLRGGKVARGGIRWSDRKEDFRMEVLGLVKAQMVKNAVIVPVGSKGGFIVKSPPADQSELMQEVVECYKTLIRGMLDITDNLVAGKIVPPPDVKRYDDDDPYLVVAADKGTATFSDIANEVAEEYNFWLGDAFASGGSTGYDHKGMGITARGGWESVKRHFRELGHDIQKEDFTVVGVGDMGGDVFGNGMLLSKHIKLVGAFNHAEIFLDPNPDIKKSYAERQRLFNNPGGSGWKNYSKELISKGGGVYDRTTKAIEVSSEVQKLFGIKSGKLTPNELINTMLKAPVDLLWNGGIGTYVKASAETHEDAADRANDSVRVNGGEIRCRVAGEGGNLGMTQLGRVEYCRNGGRCYTDFIDNSGGVDCSDHEVNIKILLNHVVNEGEMTVKQRNRLLVEMTDDVAGNVLEDNYEQSQAISMVHVQASSRLQDHARFIRELEREGKLNRELEYLPDNEAIQERELEGSGLTYPEISVLLAYAKTTLYQQLLDSDVPEDVFLGNDLKRYFPERLSEQYEYAMRNHPLKRELVATHITNNMLNRVGPTFAFIMNELTQADYPEITRAYTAAREIFSIREVWQEIEALDNAIEAQVQMKMLYYAGGLIERATIWLLRHRKLPIDVQATIDYYQTDIQALSGSFPAPLSAKDMPVFEKSLQELADQNVPKELARKVAGFIFLSTALDIVEISKHTGKPVPYVAVVYFEVGARLDLMWIRDQVALLEEEDRWHSRAKSRLRDDIHTRQYEIASEVVKSSKSKMPKHAVAEWIEANDLGYRRLTNLLLELRTASKIDFATLSVAISEVHSLSRRVESVKEDSRDS